MLKTWLSRKTIIKELTKPYRSAYGRSRGRIVLRYRRAPFFLHVHITDQSRLIWNVYGVVIGLEKDLSSQTYIALLSYPIGVLAYITATSGISIGDRLLNSTLVPFKSGNSLPLMNVPLNVKICLIESFPGSGPRFVRSPGSWAVVHSKDAEFVKVIFRNGGHRFFHITCLSVLGAVSNSKQKLRKFYKAGNSHKFGRRPRVRGVAQNPVDHPHGGGKGKKSKNAVPEGPWGRTWKRKKKQTKIRF